MAGDEADILILDEPTRGIDIGAKTEIYHLIVEMAKAGVAVILISSEMEEIINLSTRIIVMYEGRIKAILTEEETRKVAQEDIMWYASGRSKNEAENTKKNYLIENPVVNFIQRNAGILIGLAALFIFLSVATNSFLSTSNMLQVLRQICINACWLSE